MSTPTAFRPATSAASATAASASWKVRAPTFSSSFGKTFHVTERFGVHYEAQFANLFNFNNWGIPNLNVGSSSFGQITNQQDGTPGSQAGPRSITMSLRLTY